MPSRRRILCDCATSHDERRRPACAMEAGNLTGAGRSVSLLLEGRVPAGGSGLLSAVRDKGITLTPYSSRKGRETQTTRQALGLS